MKFCMKCGYKMADNVNFCPKCGTKQGSIDTTDNQNYSNEQASSVSSKQQINYQSRTGDFILGQPQRMNFEEIMGYSWKHKFEFNSNLADNQKSVYWETMVGIFLINLVFYLAILIPSVVYGVTGGVIIYYLIVLFFSIIQLPLMMRRLNYLGRNKNIAWLVFIPLANLYTLYLMLINTPAK